VSKTGMLTGTINKGYADFKLNISANILDPANITGLADLQLAKCKLMSGTIWVLALR
jgi:hypothetical protein